MPAIRDLLGGKRAHLAEDLRVAWSNKRIDVFFANGRQQVIRYKREGELFLFTSLVARPKTVRRHGEGLLARRILERNRVTELVGFRLTKNGGIEAFLRHRADTLQREELLFFLGVLAREADRFEYLVTGRDLH